MLRINQFNISESAILLLVFSIPFPHKYSNIAIALLAVVTIFEWARAGKNPRFSVFWFLPVLFAYFILSELISGGTWSSIEKRLLFLVIPLVFGFHQSLLTDQFKKKISISFIGANAFAVLFCLARAAFNSLSVNEGVLNFNPKIIQDTQYDFFTSAVMGGNYFFGEDFSWFLHPSYFGLYIVYAQYLIFEIFISEKSKRKIVVYVTVYLFFIFSLFLLSSKTALISSFLLTMTLFFLIPSSRLVKLMAGVFIVIFGLILFYNPKMKAFRNTFFSGLEINPQARFGHDLRILSWDASFDIIKRNWIVGVGEARKTEALVNVYNLKGYAYPAEEKFNSHNQYLDLLIGGGILGLGIYFSGLVVLLINSLKQSNNLLLAFILIFSFNALFENLLSRHAGIIVFTLFITVLLGGAKSNEAHAGIAT